MASLPPDPYVLKFVETTTKTVIELLHEDVRMAIKELRRIIKERGEKQAVLNAKSFDNALGNEFNQRISIGLSPDGFERINGNIKDPDFAYIVRQATVSAARTQNEDKHKLLARAVSERLLSQPESLVALSSSMACEIIPNLTSMQLLFLGLFVTTFSIRPSQPENFWQTIENAQEIYISWLETQLEYFYPFPEMRSVDIDHLRGMSCIDYIGFRRIDFAQALQPDFFPGFIWPEGYLEKSEMICDLKKVVGSGQCSLTTIGSVIGTYVHDIKTNSDPTEFDWEEEPKTA